MGEVVVVADEEMDTRPICDTQAEARGSVREGTAIVWPCLVCPKFATSATPLTGTRQTT